jgi:hypothetical protein
MVLLKDLSAPEGGDPPRRKREKTGGRRRGSLNKRTKAAKLRAELLLHEGRRVKMSLPQLQEASEVFGWLMDYYAPVLGEDGKLNWTQEDRELFNQYSDLLIRCATARLPFEYPRLNAIGIAAVPGSSPQAAVQQSKHITIRLNIFDDKGELVDHSEQHNVRREDLPLLIDHDADGVRQEG